MNPFLTYLQQQTLSATEQAQMVNSLYWLDAQGHLQCYARASEPAVSQATAVPNTPPIVWVPTAQVGLYAVQVPGKRASEWRQALPYQLEEKLAEPVEQLHFAVFHRESSGLTYCAVVPKARMQQWTEELNAQGLSQALLVPDCFQLPESQTNQWLSLCEASTCTVRTHRYQGFETSECLLPLLYEKVKIAEPSLQLSTVSMQALKAYWQALLQPQSVERKIVVSLNLRQGVFRAVSKASASQGLFLKGALAMVASVGLFMATAYTQANKLQQETHNYQQQTETLFHRLFPEVKRVVNIPAQTRQKIQQLSQTTQNAGHPIQVLRQIQSAWQKMPTTALQKITWQQKAQGGRLTLSVKAPNLQAIEKVKQAMQQALSSQSEQRIKIEFQAQKVSAKQVVGDFYVDLS